MATLLPRSARILLSGMASRSSPSRTTFDFLSMLALLESRRITVRAVTDLPEPDSPTSAIVSPLWSWNDTFRTASTIPPSTLNLTAGLRASRIRSRPCCPASWRSVGAWSSVISTTSRRIDGIAQPVAERVKGKDGYQDEQHGREYLRIGPNHREGPSVLQH